MKVWPKAIPYIIPAQAGIQPRTEVSWTPAPDQVEGKLCAGVT